MSISRRMRLKTRFESACTAASDFRHRPILRFLREMATDRQMLVRRLREGGEFFSHRKSLSGSRSSASAQGEQVQLQA